MSAQLRSDASYLVIGGFGGIGRSVCRWLVEHGARNLVIVSRRAGNKDRADQLCTELEEFGRGVRVTAIGCDISDGIQLRKSLDAYTGGGAPAIKGIIHGGMELRVCCH